MQLTDIENLSAADLKAKRAELVTAAAKAKPEELAARYVQARTDATMRDEKLSEQGTTITNLNDALAQAKQAIALRDQAIQKAATEFEQLTAARKVDAVTAAGNIATLTEQLAAVTKERDAANARADRLKAEAARHATAFSAATKALADAAALDQIEAADKGE